MPNKKGEITYDPKNKDSILNYAKRLKGQTLGKFVTSGEIKENNKGGFDQVLESGYFQIENNNNPAPDFEEAGIELKSKSFMAKNKDLLILFFSL